jgi:hypothetical protein
MFSSSNATSHAKVDPIIGSKKRMLESFISDSTNKCHIRQPAHYGAPSKRQRQNKSKDELQYIAATIQQALVDTGRQLITIMISREHSLPPGSVDMNGSKVMTSSEYDAQPDHKEENGDQGNDCDEYNLSSMYLMSSLIQSTRHHYESSPNYEAKVRKVTVSNCSSSSNNDFPTTNQSKNLYTKTLTNEQLGEDNEDNSEGLSSWTPSQSSFSHLKYNERKNIDNDNRSDGQSSGMPGGEEEEESSGTSSYSDSNASSMNGDDDVEERYIKADEDERMKKSEDSDVERPYSVIG